MPYAEIKGVRFFYEVEGEPHLFPVVFTHGLGGDHLMWFNQRPIFRQQYRVVLWDCRGHGRSEVPEWGYSITQFVEDLYGLLRSLEISRAHLVGLSMGGWISWSFAAAHPEMTAGLVLSDSAGYLEAMDSQWMADKQALFAASARAALERGRAVMADATIALMFAPDFIRDHPDIIALIKKQISADPGRGYALAIQKMFGEYWDIPPAELKSRLASITAPTLVLVGELDQLTPLPTQIALARAIPSARLEVIPGSGHVPPIEKPELWNRLVLDFLREVPGC